MKPTIALAQARLIPVDLGLLDRMCDLLWHPDIRRFLCDDNILPQATIRDMLARSIELDAQHLGLWAIEQSPRNFIGICGLQPVGHSAESDLLVTGAIEPLIALHPRMWGRGIATMVIDELVNYSWAKCDLKRLVAAVDEPNERSRRLMLRCGFLEIGRRPGPKHLLVLFERRHQA
jgi:RimJ/RimL family protein N-acetyltransferase